jgi:hypothetical protein
MSILASTYAGNADLDVCGSQKCQSGRLRGWARNAYLGICGFQKRRPGRYIGLEMLIWASAECQVGYQMHPCAPDPLFRGVAALTQFRLSHAISSPRHAGMGRVGRGSTLLLDTTDGSFYKRVLRSTCSAQALS